MAQPLDEHEWYRAGRGRYREYATISPLDLGAILDALPIEYAPYVVVSCEMARVAPNEYRELCEIISSDDVPEYADRGVWDFFIVSTVVSHSILERSKFDSHVLVINGAIDIQFGAAGKHGENTTVIGHTNHVCSEKTGEHVRFLEYSEVFESAIKAAARIEKNRR